MGRQEAERKNAAQMFDRIVNELTSRMRELVMDRTELGALRTIVLYNPGMSTLSMLPPPPVQSNGCPRLLGPSRSPLIHNAK